MIIHTNNYLETYYKDIIDGKIIAGIELKTLLESIIKDIESENYLYDTNEADRRIDFMESCIKLTKSPYYSLPMKLMDWQKAFISVVYGVKTIDGKNRYQRVLLLVARKNTKSELSSALLLTDLIFGGKGRDLVCSSNDDAQADILYNACDTMRLMIDPNSIDTWRNQKWLRCIENDNKIFKLSDRTRNKEGRNIDFAVIDEIHEMNDNTIVKSIEQSQALKDNPLLIMITTEGFVKNGFLDNELIRARRILRNEISDVASEHYLPWLYTQDTEAEVWEGTRNNRIWEKSNPSLGIIKKYEYLEQQLELARSSVADRRFVLSKDFNIKQNQSSSWLLSEDYTYNLTFDINEFKGAICLCGVDLSETTDLSCVKVLMMKKGDNRKYIYSKYFIPEGKLETTNDQGAGAKYRDWYKKGYLDILPGNYLNTSIIADWIANLYKEYKIKALMTGYDVRFANEFINQMNNYGFDTCVISQNAETLHNAIRMVESDLKSRLIIGNNELDQWCFSNAGLKIDNRGYCILTKENDNRNKRIDGAVATVILYEIFKRNYNEFIQNL